LLVKRLLTVALLAGGLAATAIPAHAAPYCGPIADVKCTPNGYDYCIVYLRTPYTCLP
jgi:hypothetical protein